MKKQVLISLFLMAVTLVRSQSVVYYCDFDSPSDTADWVLANGLQANRWTIGADGTLGSNALFVTNVATTVNYYDNGAGSLVYAYHRMALPVGAYRFSYSWRCMGERNWDFLRVFLVPDGVSLLAGVPPDGWPRMYVSGTPDGWIGLDGNKQFYQSGEAPVWTTWVCDIQLSMADTYKLVFVWVNDGTLGTQPPAAVDDVLVSRPACPVPAWPYVDRLTPTSFDLHWTDLSMGNATEWLVELDSATQTLGQGTLYNSYDTVVGFMGLEPNTDYTIHIRQVCGTDTLDTLLSVQVHTLCELLDTLPYRQDFGALTIFDIGVPCWRLRDDHCLISYYVEPSGYNNVMHWIAEQGDLIVLPGINRSMLSPNSMQLSFRGMASGSSIVRLEVGVMTDPADEETFEMVDTVTVEGLEWERYVVELARYTGMGSYVAIRNVGIGRSPCYIDDVEIGFISACQPVSHLSASHTGTTGTLLEWEVVRNTLHQPDSFEVLVERVDSGAVSGNMLRVATTEPRCLLTALEPHADYRALVRVRCVNDSLSLWDSVFFTTLQLPCGRSDTSAADTMVCGTGGNHISGVPIKHDYNNSLCHSIYTVQELHELGMTEGMIVGMDYTFTNNVFDRTFSIYITNTERDNYVSEANMEELHQRDMVYGPAGHPAGTQGTVHYAFSRPFRWDGESNIAVTTIMNVGLGEMQVSSLYGNSTLVDETRTLFRYQNGVPFTLNNSTSGFAGLSMYRPSVTFYMMGCAEDAVCAPPTPWVDSVGTDAARLEWTAGSYDTCWRVLYRLADDTSSATGWMVADTHAVGNSCRLIALIPARRYEVRLEHVCDGDTLWGLAEFFTQCAGIDTLPFVEDFEHFVAPAVVNGPIQQCWHRSLGNDLTLLPPYVCSDYAYSGSQSLHLGWLSSGGCCYMALPALGMNVGEVQLAFRAYATRDYWLKVGVMTDPTDYHTFTEVAEVTPSVLYDWEPIELPLTDYAGTGRYIALMVVGFQVRDVYVDDLRVEYLPSCIRPRNVAARSVTQTTAMLQWQGGNAVDYEVEYGPVGFAHGSGSLIAASDDSILLTGLSHASHYDVYVRSFCSGDTSDWSFVTTIQTACGMIDTLPYIKTFAEEGSVGVVHPACWTCGSNYSYGDPSIVTRINGAGQAVGRVLRIPYRSGYRSYAMLPPLDISTYPLDTVQLVLRAWSDTLGSAATTCRLIVGVGSPTDFYNTFTPLDTLLLGEVPSISEVPLSTAGMGSCIALVSEFSAPTAASHYIYLDSVVVEPLPGCQRPVALTASALTTTAATIAWQSRGTVPAARYQLEYLPHGAAVGVGTRILSDSTSATLVGLTPATAYDCYVRTICGVGDTSGWSLTPAHFITRQLPAVVPYYYSFDTLSEWDCWQTLSNTSAAWYRGIADGQPAPCMYVSADSGTTRGTLAVNAVNAVAYRDIDFGTLDTSYVISFRASVGGSSGTPREGLAVFLADPSVAPSMPSYCRHLSPWGSLDSLTLLASICATTGWHDFSIVIDSLLGIHRLVFYWYNLGQAMQGLPAAVDNISIQYSTCPRPTRLRVTHLSASTATIAWRGSSNDDYHVVLLDAIGIQVSSDTVHTNSIHYTDLTPATPYRMYVNRLCTTEPSGQTPFFYFSTDVCVDGISDTLAGPLSHHSRHELPLNTAYNYSYTQQLVSASEMHGPGEISSINFSYTGSRPLTSKANCTIYLGHTALSSFASVSGYVPPDLLQPVYVGNINCTQGWKRIFLDTPFAYNGTDNLVIAIDDNSGTYRMGSNTFDVVATSAPMTLSFYSTIIGIDCSSSSSLDAFDGSRQLLSYRSTMSFDFCPPNSCPTPLPYPADVYTDSVTLRWPATSSRYLVGYRLRSSNQWIEDNVPTADTFYTIYRSLYFDTDYVYHVRQYCDSGRVSNWAFGTFNTGDIPCRPPAGLAVAELTNHAVRLSWTPDGNHICYRVRLWGSGFDTLLTTYIAGCRIDGLNPNSQYRASVQVVCEYHDTPSLWSDTVTFETEACPDATDLTALEVHGNSVLLDWQCQEGVGQWQIEWGLQGFDQGMGTLVTVDHHPFLLTGLTGETTYDIIVRSVCDDGHVSEGWSNRLTVTTAYSGIDGVADDLHVQLTPNPTSGDMLLTLPVDIGGVRVEVIDMAGRTLQTYTLPAHTERATLTTSQLPQGAYYVRVTGDRLSTVRKVLRIK